MDGTASNPPASNANYIENARIGYESAINYSILYQNIIWSIFNTMLVANSIVVAGIGLIHLNSSLILFFRIFLPIIGLLLCFIWFVLLKRHYGLSVYYLLSAREIEECYLGDTVKTLSRGGDFTKGKPIILHIRGKDEIYKMGFLENLFTGKVSLHGIILLFGLFYVGAFFL